MRVLGWHVGVDVHLLLAEVFDRDLVERQGLDTCVHGLVALCEEGNKHVDVLFELGQVHQHVVLVELDIFVVLHGLGDGEVEVRLLEVGYHCLNEIFDLDHLVLHFFDLVFFDVLFCLDFVDLTAKAQL